MKKKKIEKIPFLTLPGVVRKKMVKYAARTAVIEIAGEAHLFIEVYKNKKEAKKLPLVRIVLTGKDFGNFYPASGLWGREQIAGSRDNRSLIWRRNECITISAAERLQCKSVMYSEQDMDRLLAFLKETKEETETVWQTGEWWHHIQDRESFIARRKRVSQDIMRRERRAAALKERMENTRKLPEKSILEYADNVIFRNRHLIFYKKNGQRAVLACSKCGGISQGRWKEGMSYESQFEKNIPEPVSGHYGICPLCKCAGIFTPQGRHTRDKTQKGYVFLGQQYKETGFLIRYVQVEKEWILYKEEPEEKSAGMLGACEKISGVEVARAYFEPGKEKVQKDYCKYNPYTGKDFWDDCNLYGNANIVIREGNVMPETYEAIKKTFFRYSAMEEYQEAAGGKINPIEYLEIYRNTPQLEMIVKLGLTGVTRSLLQCRYGIVRDINAKRPDLFLGIRTERVKQLIKHKGNLNILRVMQIEERQRKCWTEEQIEQAAELKFDFYDSVALDYMGIQQFLNRVAKYAGCGYGTKCSSAENRLESTMRLYIDYLEMRRKLGYDMGNMVYLFPRDLNKAHRKMVEESNKKEMDIRVKRAQEEFPLIKKNYRKWRQKFYYEDGEFIIRPARDAGEIVLEGRMLHHCVGGDGYLDRHNKGERLILFLRFRKEKDMPYITVEIDPETYRILQWYGAYDKKPDNKNMDRWLGAYTTSLKCRKDGTQKEAAAGAVAVAAVTLPA